MSLGKIIEVDLTSRMVKFRDYASDVAHKYLGGFGFNTWYLSKNIPSKTPPLGPENILLISPGFVANFIDLLPLSNVGNDNRVWPTAGQIKLMAIVDQLSNIRYR